MKKHWISRESDLFLRPDLGFIRDGVKDLKKNGVCYAYTKEQAEDIQKLYKLLYKSYINIKISIYK